MFPKAPNFLNVSVGWKHLSLSIDFAVSTERFLCVSSLEESHRDKSRGGGGVVAILILW